jgi:hypothetical protein
MKWEKFSGPGVRQGANTTIVSAGFGQGFLYYRRRRGTSMERDGQDGVYAQLADGAFYSQV